MAAYPSDSNQSREQLIQENAELRSRLGQELRQSERKFRSIFDNVGDSIFICDMKANILEVNEVACNRLGYTRDELLKMMVMDIDAPASARLVPAKMQEMATKDQMVSEAVHRRKDGTEIHVEVNVKKIEYEGQTCILSVVRDIGTRKKIELALRDSEERFRLFMDNSPTVAWMKDEHGRYVYVSKATLRRYNKSADEVIGKTDADLTVPEIAERLRQNDQEALSAGHAIYYNEEIIDPDGNGSHWLNSKFPFQDSAGRRFVAGVGVEITERKRMEAALQESEHRFRALFEHSPDAVFLTIPEGSIEAVNPAACAMFGRSGQELITMDRSGLIDENDPRLSAGLKERQQAGSVKAVELTAIRNGGEKFPVEVDSVILPGEPARSFVIMRDITERKRAREALRESERQVRKKLETVLSPQGDLGELELADLIDASALQALMNDFYTVARIPMSIIDLKGKVLVGVGWQEICTKFHRMQHETLSHCLESDIHLSAGLKKGECRLYKCKNNLWDMATPIFINEHHVGNILTGQFFFEGETIDYAFFRAQAIKYGFNEEEYLAALDRVPRLKKDIVDKGMSFFIKLAETISQLGYSNAKLARLLAERERLADSLQEGRQRLEQSQQMAHVGSWDLDFFHKRLTWSDEVYRIFGLQPQEFGANYEAFLERVHPEDREAVNAAYTGSIIDNKGAYELEHRIVQKSTGEIRHVHERCQHFRNADGAIIRSVGMIQDITERKQAEEALRQLNETLEKQVAERTALADSRSKQLQALAVELIETEERERRQFTHLLHEDLQQVLAAAKMQVQAVAETIPSEHMLACSVLLLDESIAKARSLANKLSPPILHQAGLIACIEWLIRQMKEQFDLNVELELNTELLIERTAQKIFLFRAVQELLFNIIMHAGVKEAIVEVTSSEDCIIVRVSDHGRGFDPEVLHDTGKSGFGLLTIQERAIYIGGAFSIESVPGQGSRFTLTVPNAATIGDNLPEPNTPVEPRPLTAVTVAIDMGLKTTRVLFVDDHKIMRQGLINLVKIESKIDVVGEASTGLEALEKARNLHPDVIVMDISMPEMDGIEATRCIKTEMPQVRIIGLTMHSDEQLITSMLQAGAEVVLSKTISAVEMVKLNFREWIEKTEYGLLFCNYVEKA